ncbi:hypothetical protein [Paraburkholderia aromaticivorans]|uniref:hypothetical protein n=1 Tax=Paraburkholderia aromaticivorans TaxID=2026199 RepID=UPI001FC8F14F|nr:hypothetical protein [Paraburkholderia aromaticivorans]
MPPCATGGPETGAALLADAWQTSAAAKRVRKDARESAMKWWEGIGYRIKVGGDRTIEGAD